MNGKSFQQQRGNTALVGLAALVLGIGFTDAFGPNVGTVLCVVVAILALGRYRTLTGREREEVINRALLLWEEEATNRYVAELNAGLTDTQARLNVLALMTQSRPASYEQALAYIARRPVGRSVWYESDNVRLPGQLD